MKTREVTRKQKEKQEAAQKSRKLRKRAKILFVRKDKLIRRNDMITDPVMKKIKLDPEADSCPSPETVVKEEPEDLQQDVPVITTNDMAALDENGLGNAVTGGQASSSTSGAEIGSTSYHCKTERLTPTETLELEIEELKKLLKQSDDLNDKQRGLMVEKDAENERLKALLQKRDTENVLLGEKITGIEAELASEKKISENLTSELEQMKKRLQDKDAAEAATGSTLRLQLEIMKTLLDEKYKELSSEINTSSSLRRQLENTKELLHEKDKQLSSEAETCSSLRRQMEKMNQLVGEKDKEIQHLNSVLRNGTNLNKRDDKILSHFEDVLKILIERERKFERVRWMEQMGMLKTCRLVCKSWRQSVDHILQQDPIQVNLWEFISRRHLWIAKQICNPCPLIFSTHDFDSGRSFQEFIKLLQQGSNDPSYNPLPTRHLMIEYNHDYFSKWADYFALLTKYLQVFGKQVWYLTLYANGWRYVQDYATFCKTLSEWFQLLPHIKSLTMLIHKYFAWPKDDYDYGVDTASIDDLVFPHLNNLTNFQCNGESQLFRCILRNNRHINQLGSSIGKNDFGSPLFEIDFPNLCTCACNVEHVDDWETFSNFFTDLEDWIWKLEDLSVNFPRYPRPTPMQFVDGIKKFRNTLTSLTFNLSQIDTSNNDELVLNLPHLKKLNLIIESWEPVPFDGILVPLENLESFSLELSLEVISSYLLRNYPYESTIKTLLDYVNNFPQKMDWMKFSKLRNVKFSFKFDGFEVGDRQGLFVMRRSKLPAVRFDVVKIADCHIRVCDNYWYKY